jgi:peptidoglycan/LPS O-acetylase OafA/YrhL
MRTHFVSRLALLFLAGFLAVASQVWSGDTLQWLFVGGGAAIIVVALADLIGPSIQQRALDGVLVLLGAWTVVEAFVFENTNLEWWSFASAAALAGLAAIGLTLHEASTERVVHELSVTADREHHAPAAA